MWRLFLRARLFALCSSFRNRHSRSSRVYSVDALPHLLPIRFPMRLHRTHFFLAAILVFASTALAADDLLEPSPFAKEGISLNLPKSWKDQPHDADHPLLVASPAASDTDTTGDYTPVLIIRATPRPNSAGPINGDAQQANVAQEMTNYQIPEKPH